MNVKKIAITIAIIISVLILIYFCYTIIFKNSYIIENGGGFETAYVAWNEMENSSSYNVYIKNIKDDEYKKIDKQLIRKYKKNDKYYWRVDAIGLEEGNYQFKIVPVIDNQENESNAITTENIKVQANLREGFSFSKNSKNGGESSGGYLENGTVPDDAKIIYITKENINTIAIDIQKNNGEILKATGLSEILTKWDGESVNKHLIVRILGKIERQDVNGLDDENKAIKIQDGNSITLEGVGNDATLKGIGILIQNCSNIEVRNLGIMLYYEDAISLNKNNSNIWIHNNDIFYGEDRGNYDGNNKEKGDGATDIRDSEYVTISYNHYWDCGKTSLCGNKNEYVNYITYHHNWFDHSDSRCPRVRYASVHIYNNYYVGNRVYSIGASDNASIFVESNYFKNCSYPMLISSQGSDTNRLVLSNECGGMIKAYNNLIEGKNTHMIYANGNNTQFDAYLATSKTDQVSDNYKTLNGENIYNNFDTNLEIMYNYKVHEPSKLENIVTNNAGRLEGGDIEFDTSTLDVNSYHRDDRKEKELDTVLKNYETSLILTQN